MPSISQTQRTKAVIGARCNIAPAMDGRSVPYAYVPCVHRKLRVAFEKLGCTMARLGAYPSKGELI